MIDSQRELLFNRTGKYLSIGISEEGLPYGSYAVPWDSTANAYNMKLPDVYLSREDLDDAVIMSKLGEFTVLGCYIFCPLRDYSFLRKFPKLMDLNIHKAHHLDNLGFLEDIEECILLFLSGAHLPNLDEIILRKGDFCFTNPKNLALYDCIVDDISALAASNCLIRELVVCNPKDRNERKRWKGIRNVRYYDLKDSAKQ